ncbi:MAG: PaaI family thioesterase [Gammaproteobacteria bacterium]|nr:PaaI family thioesterase [Gammaproteobacteria bacterium]
MAFNIFSLLKKLPFIPEKKFLEWYPPFFLMRVKVLEVKDNGRIVRLKLPLTIFSKNMGNSMFGGYQAAVADPVAALVCAKLFPGNEVWTRSQYIDFQHEGNSDLELYFEFPAETEQQIVNDLATKGRSTPTFEYSFYRNDGVRCSKITNTVAIRPKGYQLRREVRKSGENEKEKRKL